MPVPMNCKGDVRARKARQKELERRLEALRVSRSKDSLMTKISRLIRKAATSR
jgi:hypothetical protein